QAVATTGLLALCPAMVWSGALGNADHHVHEPLVLAAAALALGHALRTREVRWAVLTGAVLGMGRLLTPLAFAFLPLMAGAVAVAALFQRARASAFGDLAAWAGATAASVLAVGMLLWGIPSSVDYEFLTWFHPVLAGVAFGGAAALCWAWGGGPR